MKNAAAVLVLMIACLVLGVSSAQQGKGPEKPQVGKPIEVPADKLPRFKQPIPKPPKQEPPQKPGGSWHWHPQHAWVWFPRAQAPRTVILAPTYQLPQRVYYYQQQSASYIVCPHCGQTIVVE